MMISRRSSAAVAWELPHSEVIDDEQRNAGEIGHVLLAALVERGVDQLLDEHVGLAVVDLVALSDGSPPEGLNDVTLPAAGRPEEQYVLALADEARGRELEDELAVHLRVER